VITAVKGMRDILPPSSSAWNRVEAAAREVFRVYNYPEIRTPILEETALFVRGVGEDTDVVSKEMYTFEDRDGASLTLRPEATASVMRAYIEHRLDQIPGVKKYYYIGPMFRRERPQKGRFRQFYQIGAEAIGSESPMLDAEVIEMVVEVLRRAGIEGFTLLVNSIGDANCRPAYLALLKEKLRDAAPKMCGDCQRRAVTNPLRVLDCKVPEDQPIIDSLPAITDHLCDPCREHFASVRAHLDVRGIQYQLTPRLVRGLDYYMRTTFEITHGSLGSQNSVLGGGRYDGLAESLGSRVAAPGIGFSIGEDRLVMTVEEAHPDKFRPVVDVFLASLGEAAGLHASGIAAELRAHGVVVERSADRKLRRAFEVADKTGARLALTVGENEIGPGRYPLKRMSTGQQWLVARGDLVSEVRRLLALPAPERTGSRAQRLMSEAASGLLSGPQGAAEVARMVGSNIRRAAALSTTPLLEAEVGRGESAQRLTELIGSNAQSAAALPIAPNHGSEGLLREPVRRSRRRRDRARERRENYGSGRKEPDFETGTGREWGLQRLGGGA